MSSSLSSRSSSSYHRGRGRAPEAYAAQRRGGIRKADKLGVEVERRGQDAVADFARLFTSTVSRLDAEKGVSSGGYTEEIFGQATGGSLTGSGRLYVSSSRGRHRSMPLRSAG